MSNREWTPAQRVCFEDLDGTLLVSAAAGSGKTSVLVERVLHLIAGPETPDHPAPLSSIDRLMIATFTRAAADEMKQRLTAALTERLEKGAQDAPRLRRQLRLIGQAPIGTLHSFCLKLIQDHYYLLDISPDVVVADETACLQWKDEAITEALEAEYAENDPAFSAMVQALSASQKNDAYLKSCLLRIFDYMQAYPYPERWFEEKAALYAAADDEGEPPFVRLTGAAVSMEADRLRNACGRLQTTLTAAESAVKPDLYAKLIAECETITACLDASDAGDFSKANDLLQRLSFAALTAGWFKPSPAVPIDVSAESVKSLREDVKKKKETFAGLVQTLLPDRLADDLTYHATIHEGLRRVLARFAALYAEKKRSHRRLEFSDLEHLTIRLLETTDENGNTVKTPLAKRLAAQYDEILVDEYQDTNAAQDEIYRALSQNEENLFFVGDVKQSIYGFRRAMPSLFLGRRDRYAPYGDGVHPATVILGNNFRSRREVTEMVNFLFHQWMTAPLGGMEYDEREELVCSAHYPPQAGCETELHLLEDSKAEDCPTDEQEATEVARTIRRLMTEMPVKDEASADGATRPMRYRDIAILVRTHKNMRVFRDVLARHGIPSVAGVEEHFFRLIEVARTIALLQVIDNPVQDIPLLTVLLSPMYGFLPDDLAFIRQNHRGLPLYIALQKAARQADVPAGLSDRIARFFADMRLFRRTAASKPVDRLIQTTWEVTQYPDAVRALPDGDQRIENLHALYLCSKSFADIDGGLGRFLRYCAKAAQEDKGPEVTAVPVEDAVSIMTIHHSKGLEFPVVFLSDLGRTNHHGDENNAVLMQDDFGVTLKRVDTDLMTVRDTIPHRVAREALRQSGRAEDLRLLYVALTRAKEKLILTGVVPDIDKACTAAYNLLDGTEPIAAQAMIDHSSTLMQWVLMGLLRHPDFVTSAKAEYRATPIPCDVPLSVFFRRTAKEEAAETVQTAETAGTIEGTPDGDIIKNIREHLAYTYPHAVSCTLSAKITASHLPGEAAAPHLTCSRPAFLTDGKLDAAARGTAMHTFMQLADFAAAADDPAAELRRLTANGQLTEPQAAAVDLRRVRAFFEGALYRRLAASDRVLREWRFSFEMPASRFAPGADDSDSVTVQGMIDCAFFEPDGIVLLDYKTDHVTDPEPLAERYRDQLAIYAAALEAIFHLPVKEQYLYSFALKREIRL